MVYSFVVVGKVHFRLYVDTEDTWKLVGFVVSKLSIIESGGGRIRSLRLLN